MRMSRRLSVLSGETWPQLRAWVAALVEWLHNELVGVRYTIGAAVGTARPVTVHVCTAGGQRQVVASDDASSDGRFIVDVVVGTADTGLPAGVQVVTFSSGQIVQTIAANQAYRVVTEADGTIDLSIDGVAAPWNRYLSVFVRSQQWVRKVEVL